MATRRLVTVAAAAAAALAILYVRRRRAKFLRVTIAAKGFRRKHTVFMTVRLADGSEARVLFKAKSLGGLLDEDVVSSLHRSLRIGDEVTVTVGRREMQENGQELLHIASATIEQMCVASNVGFTRFVPPPSSELPPPPPPPPPLRARRAIHHTTSPRPPCRSI